ncbi:MAG: cytochrome c oxidase subunit II [Hyphomicrobiaceae bacterium]
MWTRLALAALLIAGVAGSALAGTGQPSPWQHDLQGAATPVMEWIHSFHLVVTVIITVITVFVLVLLGIVIVRFNERANPTPSQVTHNTMLEVAWTVVPIIILVVIAIPSFKLLFFQYSYPPPDLTIKATGKAWYWEHEYPDYAGFSVTSTIVRDEDVLRAELGEAEFNKRYPASLQGLERAKRTYIDAQPLWAKQGKVRQLSVDNEIAVPVNKVVHVLITSADVIHSWTIPSFGSKADAVPGRVSATWFKPTKTGIFYGQCSELCGKDHSAMPISIRVMTQANFDAWSGALKAAKTERDSKKRRELINQAKEIMQKAALEDQRRKGMKVAAGAVR